MDIKTDTGAHLGFEVKLWAAADALRNNQRGSMDIDNLPKPILDALKGLVYLDDEQVTDIVCHKRDLNRALRVANPSHGFTPVNFDPALVKELLSTTKRLC